MWTRFIVVAGAAVLLSCLPGPVRPAAGAELQNPHVRSLSRATAQLVAEASQRSPVVRDLVAQLDGSDVVVYVDDAVEGCNPDLRACLTFLVSAGGRRYLLVRVDRWLVAPWDRIAWLAHELQHAVEIAGAPDVQDATSLARFYRRVGWESGHAQFETSLARAAGDLARRQLGATPR